MERSMLSYPRYSNTRGVADRGVELSVADKGVELELLEYLL